MNELNIEQEHREFGAAYKALHPNRTAYLGWVEIKNCFRDPIVQGAFEMWLAAKRASMGNVEPVFVGRVFVGQLTRMRSAVLNKDAQALADMTRLYTASRSTDTKDAELGRIAMRFVDRAGDVHPGIDDADRICREFYKAMSDAIDQLGLASQPRDGK